MKGVFSQYIKKTKDLFVTFSMMCGSILSHKIRKMYQTLATVLYHIDMFQMPSIVLSKIL